MASGFRFPPHSRKKGDSWRKKIGLGTPFSSIDLAHRDRSSTSRERQLSSNVIPHPDGWTTRLPGSYISQLVASHLGRVGILPL